VTVNSEEYDDLFWAIRGGSGNFGVVTSFRYRLHPVETVWGGTVLYPIEQAGEVLLGLDAFAQTCADDVSIAGGLLTGPEGKLVVAVAACHCGPLQDGARALQPLRVLGSPIADFISPMPYPALQGMLDGAFPPGLHHYWKASFIERITGPMVDTAVAFMQRKPSPHTVALFQRLHGAAARVPEHATAFPHRRSQYDFGILSMWPGSTDAGTNLNWTQQFYAAVEQFLDKAVYVNNLGEEGDPRVRAAYGDNYAKLLAVKKKYDPSNFFRLNHNIDPAQA
jgi:FAD/FMN-containing dehydrogenase